MDDKRSNLTTLELLEAVTEELSEIPWLRTLKEELSKAVSGFRANHGLYLAAQQVTILEQLKRLRPKKNLSKVERATISRLEMELHTVTSQVRQPVADPRRLITENICHVCRGSGAESFAGIFGGCLTCGGSGLSGEVLERLARLRRAEMIISGHEQLKVELENLRTVATTLLEKVIP